MIAISRVRSIEGGQCMGRKSGKVKVVTRGKRWGIQMFIRRLAQMVTQTLKNSMAG